VDEGRWGVLIGEEWSGLSGSADSRYAFLRDTWMPTFGERFQAGLARILRCQLRAHHARQRPAAREPWLQQDYDGDDMFLTGPGTGQVTRYRWSDKSIPQL
jgi:hypothetical protein